MRPMACSEQHNTPSQLAELWGWSTATIRALFENEPGVIRLIRPATRSKRVYNSMRIPLSVQKRVYERITRKIA